MDLIGCGVFWENGCWSMTFLPIVGRELRIAARLPATYRNRVLTAGVVAAVAFVMLFFASLTGSSSFIGETTFRTLSYLTLGFCLLEGVRKTADCLSGEKREGTLGLLFLTDLKGYDVVFGKLVATSLNSFYGLMAVLPVLALPLLLGGVTPGEYWRVVLALLNILFFSLCAGMCVSSLIRSEEWATGNTALVIAMFAGLPLLTFTRFFYPFSPVYAFHAAFDANYPGASSGYWESLGIGQVWSWMLLVCASLAAPRFWQQKAAGTTMRFLPARNIKASAGIAARRARSRAQALNTNPVLWLAEHERGQHSALYVLVGITACGSAFFFFASGHGYLTVFLGCAWLLNFILKTRMAAQACHCMTEARRNNTLEMLLATPLTVNQIIDGQIQALHRIFFAPVVLILGLEAAGLGLAIAKSFTSTGRSVGDPGGALLLALGYLIVFGLDVGALQYVGMWFGLTSKRESQATMKTIVYVLIAPFVAMVLSVFSIFFSCFGFLAFLIVPICLMIWAKARLEQKFRELAGTRYALRPVDPYARSALSFAPPRLVPPVINQ
jgi:ABC-type Na+ efflux pump permease subunit